MAEVLSSNLSGPTSNIIWQLVKSRSFVIVAAVPACPGSSVGERCPEEAVVPGSNPGLGTTKTENISSVAVITGRCQRSNPGSNPG
jgi:hypothetical protein